MMEKKFERSMGDKKIAGVCSGLAKYFGVDVQLVRVVAVLLFVFASSGLWAYLILWAMMKPDFQDVP
ncbi:MAG: PspC domain-containing protein [Eubacteriales bacterium]